MAGRGATHEITLMNEAPFRSAFACLNRRQVFQVGAGAVLVEVTCSKAANASAKLQRGAVSYEDHPSVGKPCSACGHYIPNAEASSPEQCQVVAGEVGPHGHCILWTERNPSDSC